jgi:hypothetical protein
MHDKHFYNLTTAPNKSAFYFVTTTEETERWLQNQGLVRGYINSLDLCWNFAAFWKDRAALRGSEVPKFPSLFQTIKSSVESVKSRME